MNSLVKSTFDQLTSRLKRAGTLVKPTPMGALAFDSLRFNVVKDGASSKDDSYIKVDVALWHQKNVYIMHDDKVQITLSNLAGQQSQFTFFPRTGNCPPLDKVESKIRELLEARILADKNNVQAEAQRQEAERLADLECPVPAGVSVSRKRYPDGTYEVNVSCYGMTARGVNQLIQIAQANDAIQPPQPDPPVRPAPGPVEPLTQPRPRSYTKRNAAQAPLVQAPE